MANVRPHYVTRLRRKVSHQLKRHRSMHGLSSNLLRSRLVICTLCQGPQVTNCTGHLFESDEAHIHRFELSYATMTLDSFIRLQEALFKKFDGIHTPRKPPGSQRWSFVMWDNKAIGHLRLCGCRISISDYCAIGWVICFHCTWIPDVLNPNFLQLNEWRPLCLQQELQKAYFATNADGLHA